MVTLAMPRSRWTKPRVARMAFLMGRGLKKEAVASDPLVDSYPEIVRKVANNLGLAFSDVPRGNLIIDVGGKLAVLTDYARQRGETAESVASRVLRILTDEPTVMSNLLDDEV